MEFGLDSGSQVTFKTWDCFSFFPQKKGDHKSPTFAKKNKIKKFYKKVKNLPQTIVALFASAKLLQEYDSGIEEALTLQLYAVSYYQTYLPWH